MSENLKTHIKKFINISEADYAEIITYFTVVEAAKKQNLLIAGKICKSNYFVSKGCLRLFFVNEKNCLELRKRESRALLEFSLKPHLTDRSEKSFMDLNLAPTARRFRPLTRLRYVYFRIAALSGLRENGRVREQFGKRIAGAINFDSRTGQLRKLQMLGESWYLNSCWDGAGCCRLLIFEKDLATGHNAISTGGLNQA